MNPISTDEIPARRWAELVRSRFRVTPAGAAPCLLELTEVTTPRAAEAGSAGARHENFSLLFDGPGDRLLPQRIYTFEHDDVGQFELFIVPVGNERGRLQYQAVFNRLRRET